MLAPLCRTCELAQHKHKRNASLFFCLRTNRRMYQLRLWLLTKMATKIEEKHCACVCPYAFAYLTHVNVLVLMLVLVFMLASHVWTSLEAAFLYRSLWMLRSIPAQLNAARSTLWSFVGSRSRASSILYLLYESEMIIINHCNCLSYFSYFSSYES